MYQYWGKGSTQAFQAGSSPCTVKEGAVIINHIISCRGQAVILFSTPSIHPPHTHCAMRAITSSRGFSPALESSTSAYSLQSYLCAQMILQPGRLRSTFSGHDIESLCKKPFSVRVPTPYIVAVREPPQLGLGEERPPSAPN